jgi:hypothetical protein
LSTSTPPTSMPSSSTARLENSLNRPTPSRPQTPSSTTSRKLLTAASSTTTSNSARSSQISASSNYATSTTKSASFTVIWWVLALPSTTPSTPTEASWRVFLGCTTSRETATRCR